MDSIFSELPRDMRFLIYKKAMHAMFREERAAIKKHFREQIQPQIHDGTMSFSSFWRRLNAKTTSHFLSEASTGYPAYSRL